MLHSPCNIKTKLYRKENRMNKNVTVEINMKGVNKKLEKIAKKKYPPVYMPSEYMKNGFQYSTPQKIYTYEGPVFVPESKDIFYSQPKEDIPFGYHRIRCQHCENVIAIPMGYNHCPECEQTVYADKNIVFLK